MRIAVLYNQPETSPAEQHWLSRSGSEAKSLPSTFTDTSESGVVQEARLIERFLSEAGHETVLYPVSEATGLVDILRRGRPDLIFNCCEALRGNARLEMNVAAVFEILEIPFTGSPALTLGMALNKGIAKALFAAHGVATPPWAVLPPQSSFELAARLRYPVIVKPLNEDASAGIDIHSIVEDDAGLMSRVRFVWEEFRQPALAEEFIDGRELNVAVLAANPETFIPLPVSEILFEGFPHPKHHIVTYEAKWMADSPYYASTVPCCPARLDPALEKGVQGVALRVAAAVGLRDYGRIDLRVRASDNAVFAIEANPNPDISADSGFVRAAKASGRTHSSVILEIVERALERARRQAYGRD